MRYGLARLKTADTCFSFQKKSLYALFRRQVDFRQALLSSSTGRASQGRRATTCERLDAVSPVPSFDLNNKLQLIHLVLLEEV
jgi:hypothetical protein